MAEEQVADKAAFETVKRMQAVRRDVRKLELKTLSEVIRECRRLEAECDRLVPTRILQGGGKSQHRKEKR